MSDRPAPKLSCWKAIPWWFDWSKGDFGPQPFLAMKGLDARVFHDNLDVQRPGKLWTYVFDDQTLPLSASSTVGVGSAGRCGGSCAVLEIRNDIEDRRFYICPGRVQGLLRKNLLALAGKPLIVHSIEIALGLSRVSGGRVD